MPKIGKKHFHFNPSRTPVRSISRFAANHPTPSHEIFSLAANHVIDPLPVIRIRFTSSY